MTKARFTEEFKEEVKQVIEQASSRLISNLPSPTDLKKPSDSIKVKSDYYQKNFDHTHPRDSMALAIHNALNCWKRLSSG